MQDSAAKRLLDAYDPGKNQPNYGLLFSISRLMLIQLCNPPPEASS